MLFDSIDNEGVRIRYPRPNTDTLYLYKNVHYSIEYNERLCKNVH